MGSRKHCFLKNQKRERLSRDYLSLIPHDDRTRRTKKKKGPLLIRTLTYMTTVEIAVSVLLLFSLITLLLLLLLLYFKFALDGLPFSRLARRLKDSSRNV